MVRPPGNNLTPEGRQMGQTPPPIGTEIWYAQVLKANGKPPVARVLRGSFLRQSKTAGHWRIKLPHARFGLDVSPKWCARRAGDAEGLLTQRLSAEQAEHIYQIAQLRHALARHLRTLTIAWPSPSSAPAAA